MIEDKENQMRNALYEIYFGKVSSIAGNDLQTPFNISTFSYEINFLLLFLLDQRCSQLLTLDRTTAENRRVRKPDK